MLPEEYRKMAEVEDVMWYYRALHRNVAAALDGAVAPGAAVLDAGCGTGGLLRRLALAQSNWRLAGLDFSEIAVRIARERTGCPIALGSVTALPFDDAQFDAMVSCDVLCQLESPREALAEFRRCLRPGGLLVVNVPAFMWMWSYHDEAVQSKHRFVRPEMLSLLRASGLQPLWVSYWNTLPFPLAVLRRKVFPASKGGSDVRLYPAAVEAAFDVLMRLEHRCLAAGNVLPFGNSVIAVARAGSDR